MSRKRNPKLDSIKKIAKRSRNLLKKSMNEYNGKSLSDMISRLEPVSFSGETVSVSSVSDMKYDKWAIEGNS